MYKATQVERVYFKVKSQVIEMTESRFPQVDQHTLNMTCVLRQTKKAKSFIIIQIYIRFKI